MLKCNCRYRLIGDYLQDFYLDLLLHPLTCPPSRANYKNLGKNIYLECVTKLSRKTKYTFLQTILKNCINVFLWIFLLCGTVEPKIRIFFLWCQLGSGGMIQFPCFLQWGSIVLFSIPYIIQPGTVVSHEYGEDIPLLLLPMAGGLVNGHFSPNQQYIV